MYYFQSGDQTQAKTLQKQSRSFTDVGLTLKKGGGEVFHPGKVQRVLEWEKKTQVLIPALVFTGGVSFWILAGSRRHTQKR